jgi:hypothetical protein
MDLNKFDAININTDDINPLMEWKTNNNIYVRQFKNILLDTIDQAISKLEELDRDFTFKQEGDLKIVQVHSIRA